MQQQSLKIDLGSYACEAWKPTFMLQLQSVHNCSSNKCPEKQHMSSVSVLLCGIKKETTLHRPTFTFGGALLFLVKF